VPATIFSRLNNQYRVDLLSKYAEAELDPVIRERLQSFLAAYNICTENRNFLAHAQVHNPTQTLADLGSLRRVSGQMVLKKPPKSDPLRQNYANLDIHDLRQIADDMEQTNGFGTDLYLYMAARRFGGTFRFGADRTYTPTLPETPPTPRTLTLQDSPAQTAERRQP